MISSILSNIDSILNGKDKITDIDYNNLSVLFDKVDDYARYNYEYPLLSNKGFYYNILYNGSIYKLGIKVYDKYTYYCKKDTFNNKINYIDYKELLDYYLDEEIEEIMYYLESNDKVKAKNKIKSLIM